MRSIRTSLFITLLITGFSLVYASSAHADSLFPVKGGRYISFFSDNRAHHVGDVLTVLISENTTATSSAATQTSKSEAANFGGGVGFLGKLFSPFGASSSGSLNASGQTTRSGSLTTEMAVRIKKILPNGDFEIEGSRSLKINKETQRVRLTGIVRPEDISPQDTVSSPQVADAHIEYLGKGIIARQQHRGLISTIFSWLF